MLKLFDHYDFYWLATLVGSALVISILVVIIPASFQRRAHNGLLIVNECLAAFQLGIVTYYIAVLLDADFSWSAKTLPVLVSGLLALTFGFVVVSAKWASPVAQEQWIKEDHSCPEESPESCTARVQGKTKWRLYRLNISLFAVSMIPAVLLPFFVRTVPTTSYVGEWGGHIDWNTEWATHLLNYNGRSRLVLANPRSEGTVYIYKTAKGAYGSVSLWQLENGPDVYADVAVIGGDFEFDVAGKIKRFDMRTVFRNQRQKYEYAPFTHYYFQFEDVSETRLTGKMWAFAENQKPVEVGTVILQLK